jgi:magnesium chelatase subunit D
MNVPHLLAVDPGGLGGAVLRGSPGPARDRWIADLRAALPPGAPVRRVPLHVTKDRLLGGLDLVATLRAGQQVTDRGLLAEAEGGVVLLAMAERISPTTATHLSAALDREDRCGLGILAFDEGRGEECTPPMLLDRLAFHVDLDDVPAKKAPAMETSAARLRLGSITIDAEIVAGLCATAVVLGIASLRAPILAVRAARAVAALAGRDSVSIDDAALATRLVLAPRATVIPQEPAEPPEEPHPPEPEAVTHTDNATGAPDTGPMQDMLLAAAVASIPGGLLARLRAVDKGTPRAMPGRVGQSRVDLRGRPVGTRTGDPRAGLRLNLLETLRAAAPWQRLRGRSDGAPVQIRREDFRVTRLKQRSETTTIFVVDASGSQALNRLAEAKGAVELLLAECYTRRDKVAVLAFRRHAAELLLPPTRSLVRAKRSLAGLPGGGGTPLAAGIDSGRELADALRRRGGTPTLVLLTDGRGNVSLSGKGGRVAAERDADLAARRLRHAGHPAILVDTSVRPTAASRQLATTMGARYLALPFAGPSALARTARSAAG